jgi:hypothetical protein
MSHDWDTLGEQVGNSDLDLLMVAVKVSEESILMLGCEVSTLISDRK